MKAGVAILFITLFVGSLAQLGTTVIPAVSAAGFDIILLDAPSWVTHIQNSYGEHEFYVFGDETLRTISSGPNTANFTALPSENWAYPLIDLHTNFFNNTNANTNVTTTSRVTVGLTAYNIDMNMKFDGVAYGAYLPLYTAVKVNVSGTVNTTEYIQRVFNPSNGVDFGGVMMYGLRVDASNYYNIKTYYAGFFLDENTTMHFIVLRTYLNITVVPGGLRPTYVFDRAADMFNLYDEQFTTFSATYKPFVHYTNFWGPNNHTLVIVTDPNTRSIYSVDVSVPGATSTQYAGFSTLDYQNYDIVSTAFDFEGLVLYVGFAAGGNIPGFIATFDFSTGLSANETNPTIATLPGNYSNPKALALDSQYLYIGLNGASEILKFARNISEIVGYQRLPFYLHRSWDATATHHHVYFVTNEQNSKVFRVAKNDFCPSACPYNGYCVGGSCTCSTGYVLSHDKSTCELEAAKEEIIYRDHYRKAHGGEVALGILFALTFLVAAAGWGMWHRVRRNAYQPV